MFLVRCIDLKRIYMKGRLDMFSCQMGTNKIIFFSFTESIIINILMVQRCMLLHEILYASVSIIPACLVLLLRDTLSMLLFLFAVKKQFPWFPCCVALESFSSLVSYFPVQGKQTFRLYFQESHLSILTVQGCGHWSWWPTKLKNSRFPLK